MLVRLLNICVLFLFLQFINCSERIRDNALDPLGKRASPVALDLVPTRHSVFLRWTVNLVEDYLGFRLYRAIGDTSQFTLLKELPSTAHESIDSNLVDGSWYYYKITVLGKNVESLPSDVRQVMVGPGETWILSRYGYSIQHFSYDLKSLVEVYNLEFPPIEWCWDIEHKQIWLAYAQYGLIGSLNLETGYEDYFWGDSLQYPIDVVVDTVEESTFILDKNQQAVFELSNQEIYRILEIPDSEAWKLIQTNLRTLWVLGKHLAIHFYPDGAIINTIQFSPDFNGCDMEYQAGNIYILSCNSNSQQSRLLKVSDQGNVAQAFEINSSIKLIRNIPNSDKFIAVEKLQGNIEQFVKLSSSGNRLLEIAIENHVDDLDINSVDGSIVLVDQANNSVVLLDSTGTIKSENESVYSPVKIQIR